MAVRNRQGLRTTAFSDLIWEVKEVPWTERDIRYGTGSFRLSVRDRECLAELYDKHFLQARHFRQFTHLRLFHRRFLQLFEHGLIARAKVQPTARVRKEYVFALTRLGLDILAHGGDGSGEDDIMRDAEEDLKEGWVPPYESKGSRNNVLHELAVADLCDAIVAYCGAAGMWASWAGSRTLEQRFYPAGGRGRPLRLSPDAEVAMAEATLLIEHQRTINPEKVKRTIQKYQRYFQLRAWADYYHAPPKIIISVADKDDTQNYWADPYSEVLEIARSMNFQEGVFIPESRWRAMNLAVEQVSPKQTTLELDQVIRGAWIK